MNAGDADDTESLTLCASGLERAGAVLRKDARGTRWKGVASPESTQSESPFAWALRRGQSKTRARV